METHNDVIVKIPPPMEEMLKAFMKAAGVTTVSDFARHAVDHALRGKNQPPLAPEMFEVLDDFRARKPGGEITIGLTFKGEAAALSNRMGLEADGDSWVTDSLYGYMEALTPVLSRDDLINMFNKGVGGNPENQIYPH